MGEAAATAQRHTRDSHFQVGELPRESVCEKGPAGSRGRFMAVSGNKSRTLCG